MKEKAISNNTIKDNLCIGCGICAASCPTNAIKMEKCGENYIKPVVNEEKCINCGLCTKFCPNTFEKIKQESRKVANFEDFNEFGIKDAKYYISYVKKDADRVKSASGGIATYIAEYLLKNNKIDAVVHAKMIEGKTGEQHYEASISTGLEELNKKRRSFYCTISFDKVLKDIKEKKYKRILIIGTPCVIRGIKNFINNGEVYKKIVEKVYSIALSCSHNVNGMFTDYLADSLKISREESYKVDLRNKDNLEDANNFNNHYFKENSTICKVNRFESEFTNQWRNYSFSMNVCNSCSDFWGYEADISVKDAWGKWAQDPLGQTIVILRNDELEEIFINNDDLYVEEENKDTIVKSQQETVIFKQYYAKKRLKCKNAKELNKISFLHRLNSHMREKSLKKYKKMKKSGYNNSLKRYSNIITLIKRVYNKLKKIWRKTMGKFTAKLENIRKNKIKRLNQDKILIVGGYGYQNVGDEAQLNVVIERLKKCFPDFIVRILTPNLIYTMQTHNYSNVGEAPRIAFFKQGESLLYNVTNYDKNRGILKNFANEILKILFLIKSNWIYFNAFFIKHDLPTFLLSPSASALLYDIRTSKLIYFEGGGYLTGKTLSRLWDGILLCRIANLFNISVVMSGQTIGVWNTKFNKRYAKKGFKNVKLISLRDPKASIDALKEIGIEGENIYSVCDDALFCSKEENKSIMNKVFEDSGCDDVFRKKGYIAFNMHYWGLFRREQKEDVLEKLNKIINEILNKVSYNIVLIPMVPSDEQTMKDYLKKYPNERIRIIRYKYDFNIIRAIISEAKICVTMKHHPIIFSVGEKTPVISLNLSDYYEHKNGGAMQILNVEKYSITLSNENYFEKFIERFQNIINNYDDLCKNMDKTLKELKDKTEKFEVDLVKIMEGK